MSCATRCVRRATSATEDGRAGDVPSFDAAVVPRSGDARSVGDPRRRGLSELAADVGVSVKTIYSACPSKVGVLAAAHDVALAGDDEPVPLVERDWFRAVADSTTARGACRAALEEMHVRTARVAPLYRVMQAAEADPDVARLKEQLRAPSEFFQPLARRPGACATRGENADRDRVAAVVYATESAETCALFVTESGWTLHQWRDWVAATVD